MENNTIFECNAQKLVGKFITHNEWAIKYFGDRIGIVGSVQTRNYEAQDGTKRYVTEIVADEIELLSPKEKSEEQEKPKEQNIDDGTLPF